VGEGVGEAVGVGVWASAVFRPGAVRAAAPIAGTSLTNVRRLTLVGLDFFDLGMFQFCTLCFVRWFFGLWPWIFGLCDIAKCVFIQRPKAKDLRPKSESESTKYNAQFLGIFIRNNFAEPSLLTVKM